MRSLFAVSCTAILILFTFTSASEARDRARSGSFVTSGGKSGNFAATRSGNRASGITRTQQVTGASGRSFNRSATGQYNRQTGAFNKSVTRNGNTRTMQGTAANGVRSGTYTGAQAAAARLIKP
jgi:hypothetical protein